MLNLALLACLTACAHMSSADTGKAPESVGDTGEPPTDTSGDTSADTYGDTGEPESFILLPGGSFEMGCTPGQTTCGPDELVHTVSLTHAFWVSAREVTEAEFQAHMGFNPVAERDVWGSCGADCPVASITWYEAAQYVNALSADAGLDACYRCVTSHGDVTCYPPEDPYACAGYRLPTEAEWEASARCGTDLRFAGSDAVGDVAWYQNNTDLRQRPVGGLAANACGTYDQSGNVSEWLTDVYGEYSAEPATDPTGAPYTDYYAEFLYRGGSAGLPERGQRVSARASYYPWSYLSDVGLRVVRTAE